MTNEKKSKIGIKGLIFAIVLGFVFAGSAMGIVLDHAYGTVYIDGVETYTAKLFGLSIFELTQTGSKYALSANVPSIAIICIVFIVPCVLIQRWIHKKLLQRELEDEAMEE